MDSWRDIENASIACFCFWLAFCLDCYLISKVKSTAARLAKDIIGAKALRNPALNWEQAVLLKMSNRIGFVWYCLLLSGFRDSFAADVNEILAERQKLLDQEDKRFLGGSLTLNVDEEVANAVLMQIKHDEYDRAFADLSFPPAGHFFKTKTAVLQSQVYQIIRKMPKGGVLHVHDIAITPVDFLVNDVSYRPNLYVCASSTDPVNFLFASSPPPNLETCTWALVAEVRAQQGAAQFDSWLRSKLSLYTLNPDVTYPDINAAWRAFENSLGAAFGMITYHPVFYEYFYRALQMFYDDNVQYIEIRTTLPPVYHLNGTLLDEFQVTELYKNVFDNFKNDHPDFSGAKIIFAPIRRVDDATMTRYVTLASQLRGEFPTVVAGFDLVGQEDLGRPLKDFLNQLVAGTADPNLRFFFHAAETNWEGTDVDENLIDAILLNTTRIGHAFGITKHAVILDLVKANRIPLEICPISNQVLALVSDLRNHPAAGLFVNDFPIVISADDPASWEAEGLSTDFYMAFMGLAGKKADLRTLKQLALNSITFSAMDTDERTAALSEWQKRWDFFIQQLKGGIFSNDIIAYWEPISY